MQRKALEQRLTELALHIGEKSSQDAANALLELYKEFRYDALDEALSREFTAAEDDIKARLKARLAELQSTASVPQPAAPTPAATQEQSPEPVAEKAAPADLFEAAPATEQAPEPAQEAAGIEEPAPAEEPEPVEEPLKETVQAAAPEAPTAEESAPVAPVAPSAPKAAPAAAPKAAKSLNDRLAGKKLTFGLNDRIGFVKTLFDGSTEDFNRVVSQLNTMDSLEEATSFLEQMIAPEYRWEEQEEAAARFMSLVEQRFG